MNLGLENKLALVSASTGGIGLAIATSLANEGATVIINGRTESSVADDMEQVGKQVNGAALKKLVADIGSREGCDKAIADFPDVDILVNCLGTYEAVGFFEESDESWYRLFEVNIMSGVRLSRHYLRKYHLRRKRQGNIYFQ